MKPSFIGIGAQKCATTWVYRVLEDHPEAVLSNPKELHFFSTFFDHGYQWYESHFEATTTARAAGEFSTTYFYNADAAARAHAYNPDFRLLIALRDPVQRAYSNHLHEVRVGHITNADRSFEANEMDNPMYLEQSRYARQLRKWLAHFPPERMLVLFQEEIAIDPAEQARRLYRFLDIDDTHVSPFLHEKANVSAVDRSSLATHALHQIAEGLRSLVGERLVRDLKTNPMIKRLREANKQRLDELIPAMTAECNARLVRELGDDLRELARLLGRTDLPWASWRALHD